MCVVIFTNFSIGCHAKIYIGGSFFGISAKPKVSFTNPIYNFIKDAFTIHTGAISDDNYDLVDRDESPSEKIMNSLFATQSPDLILEDRINDCGVCFFIGLRKKLENKFSLSLEALCGYKNLTFKRNYEKTFFKTHKLTEKQKPESEEITALRHTLNIESKFYLDAEIDKHLENSICVLLGYDISNELMIFFKIGTSINRIDTKKLNIKIENINKKMIRHSANSSEDRVSPLPDLLPNDIEYSVKSKDSYFASMNFGCGFEYKIHRTYFFRIDYEYRLSFSKILKNIYDNPSGIFNAYNRLNPEYSVKYQDVEHKVGFGIGKIF